MPVADSTPQCPHPGMVDLVGIPMDVEMPGFSELVLLRKRGSTFWWLWAGECPICRQLWLVAQEERVNDVVMMRRLTADEARGILDSDVWPDDFDRYEAVIRLSQEVSRFRFADPWEQLPDVIDQATERPGIRVDELADLLNLDDASTRELAERATRENGVQIDGLGRASQ